MNNQANADNIVWGIKWRVEKFDGEITANEIESSYLLPVDVIEGYGNLVTTAGANLIWTALTGGSFVPLNSTNTAIGVGTGTSGVSSSADLTGSDKYRKQVSGAPTITTNQIQLNAVFGTTVANFAWNEWGIFNSGLAQTGGIMLNYKVPVSSLGTKNNTQSWSFTVTISLS